MADKPRHPRSVAYPVEQLLSRGMQAKTTVSALHDAQLLLNKQQQT